MLLGDVFVGQVPLADGGLVQPPLLLLLHAHPGQVALGLGLVHGNPRSHLSAAPCYSSFLVK